MHGQEVVHPLSVASFCVEVGQRGGDSLEALLGFVHRRPVLLRQWDWTQRHPACGGVHQDT